MEIYIIGLPISFLLLHSVNILLRKFKGREPYWLKAYSLFSLIYIVAIPTMLSVEILNKLNASGGIKGTVSGLIATIFLLITIKMGNVEKEKSHEI